MERFLLFVALGVSLSFGQAAPPIGTLTGKVLEASSKEGIRKATVYASLAGSNRVQGTVANFAPPTIYSASTDDSGIYRFSGLAPGSYLLRTEKAGFLWRPATRIVPATVTAGEESKGPELLLVKQAVISGRVTDADGEPLEHINVQILHARRPQGMEGQYLGQALTDDRGEFRIPRLPAGKYRILATRNVQTFSTPNATAPGAAQMVDAPTYYPSSLDESTASEVAVTGGEERTGVEIRIQRTVAVRVSGRVNGEAGLENPASVMLQPMNGKVVGMNIRSALAGLDGRFSIPNVIPGEYGVMVNIQKTGAQLTGWTRLRVAQQDVDDVNITLQPLVRLTGRVVAEGGGKLPPGQVNIGFRASEIEMRGGGGAAAKADGTFVIENVQRTKLRLNSMAPKGWYLKSVSVGGQRQPGLEVDFTAGEAPLELLYSNKPATVNGTIEGAAEGQIVAAALIDGGAAGPVFTNLYRTAPVAAGQNTFKIEDIPPGNYLIVACSPALFGVFADPVMWEKVKSKAVSVKLEEGGTVVATPRLIVESDLDEN